MFVACLASIHNAFVIQEILARTGINSGFLFNTKGVLRLFTKDFFLSRISSCITVPTCLLRASTRGILDPALCSTVKSNSDSLRLHRKVGCYFRRSYASRLKQNGQFWRGTSFHKDSNGNTLLPKPMPTSQSLRLHRIVLLYLAAYWHTQWGFLPRLGLGIRWPQLPP